MTDHRRDPSAAVLGALKRYWGYDTLRPLQGEAISAALEGRDALVVLPTGGGKSLCYQVPPLVTGRLTLVVSPLIALMKDQVDALKLAGYPGGALHSGMSAEEQAGVRRRAASGELRLLLAAPERLVNEGFLSWLDGLRIGAFAIDEAHCISQWGHDFRPEYRRLSLLKRRYPATPVQAFTATATPKVREDIAELLGLRDPAVLVGTFDRPNLTYRVLPRVVLEDQVTEAVRRHDSQAMIVYCISRRDTESLAEGLRARGIKAEAYHAGLAPGLRHRVQENFAQERTNVVTATVAFGMGIDRSNVRCVVHAAMPRSMEHYQQETGRAGRDGLASECLLLYSSADAARWDRMIERGALESEEEVSPGWIAWQKRQVEFVRRFCASGACRHRALSEYFGQAYRPPAAAGCGACDVCLGELETIPDSPTIARKIVSCVARLEMGAGERARHGFGAAHIVGVLRGSNTEAVRRHGHDRLSTFGILRAGDRDELMSCVNQLVDQGVLTRRLDEYPTIGLGAQARAVLKGALDAALVRPKAATIAAHAAAEQDGEPYDAALFEELRVLRRTLAEERRVPAFVIFGDAVLREMCRVRPTRLETLGWVRGVGDAKQREFGLAFLDVIRSSCRTRSLPTDQRPAAARPAPAKRPVTSASSKPAAFRRFDQRENIEEIAAALGVKPATIVRHLVEYIEQHRPASITPWVDDRTYDMVSTTVDKLGPGPFKPIYEHFNGEVAYDAIRLVVTHRRAVRESR